VNYLLDTHTFLWCFEGSDKLRENAKNIIRSADNQKFISVASLWEFSIKYGLGKLKFEGGLPRLLEIITRYNFILLPIKPVYLAAVIELPAIHGDPFDRMLIATAKTDGLTVLTTDEDIPKYDVVSEW